MKEGGLHKLPSFEGNAPPHQAEKNNGKGDDPQAPNLKKEHCHDLAGERKVFADVEYGETSDANRRGRSKQGIHKGYVTAV